MPLPPLSPSPLPLPGQFPPVPITTSPPVPPASSVPPHIGPESAASQYIVQPYSAFVEYRFPLDQTSNLLLPPPLRCIPIIRPASLQKTLRQSLCHRVLETRQDPSYTGGNHPRLCNEEQHRSDDRFKEKYGHTRPCPLPTQDPGYYPPNCPRLL